MIPVLIGTGVIAITCCFEVASELFPQFTFFRRLEWILYDWRVREAASTAGAGSSPQIATNLGLVVVEDASIEELRSGHLGYHFSPPWPRQVYGRALDELSRQGAKAVGFDVIFDEPLLDRPEPIVIQSNAVDRLDVPSLTFESDAYFSNRIAVAGNVVLAADRGIIPDQMFRSQAWAIADVTANREKDGVLRRAYPFQDVPIWHPTIHAIAPEKGWDLANTELRPSAVMFSTRKNEKFILRLDSSNRFDPALLWRSIGITDAPPSLEPAFEMQRMWQMGILLAARELQLDLHHAVIDRAHREIVIPGPKGGRRIPLDADGRFYVDWSVRPQDVTHQPIEGLLWRYLHRRDADPLAASRMTSSNAFAGKLVVIGSTATGATRDFGATPLDKETFLPMLHVNVANTMLQNRFIRPARLIESLLLIVVFGIFAGIVTWNLRTLHSVSSVVAAAGAYILFAAWAFLRWRLFLPIVLPVGGALVATHVTLITWLVTVEQRERRRTKDIFSKIVSPDIVKELLDSDTLPLQGARRRVTVYFADVRGFTELTDASQQRAERFASAQALSKQDATIYFDRQAGELLQTINMYLGIVAGQIREHNGTLDKYIGDCVMAFWGAPVSNPFHARDAVLAAIGAQRTIFRINEERVAENKRREAEHALQPAGTEPPVPLSVLTLGSGINTGSVTVGLMGSDANLLNYTVFGREVNLASRLESVSGRGRIIIGEETYQELLRDAPELAKLCRPQTPVTLKGFREAMNCYEVDWHEQPGGAAEGSAAITGSAPPRERESCV